MNGTFDELALSAAPPTDGLRVEDFLARRGAPVVRLPRSRMGKADASLHVTFVPGSRTKVEAAVVRVATHISLESAEGQWVLAHEAAHLVDLVRPVAGGFVWAGFLDYGKFSLALATPLRSATDYLCSLSTYSVDLRMQWMGRRLTFDEAQAHPEVPTSRKAALMTQRARILSRLHSYKRQPKELFAEAVACLLLRPPELRAHAPDLSAQLEPVLVAEGLLSAPGT